MGEVHTHCQEFTRTAAVALPQQVLPASMTHCWCLELGRHTVPTPRQMFLMPQLFVPTRFTLNIRFPTRNLQLLGTDVSLPRSRQALWVLGLRNFLAEDTLQVFPSLQLEIASALSLTPLWEACSWLLLNLTPSTSVIHCLESSSEQTVARATPHAETMRGTGLEFSIQTSRSSPVRVSKGNRRLEELV